MWHLLTSQHVLRFLFETLTDVSFLPGLVQLGKRGRHFETFIGLAQFVTSFFYNLCDALEISVLIDITEWHKINNILTITLGCFVLVYLMGNRNEARDHVLRYDACILECGFGDGSTMTNLAHEMEHSELIVLS
eukprot:m.171298 g.171298  ORF g.171298 m.171298 type:complete len:134 (-) comp14811_c0_seq3:532-933(-)